MLTYTPSEELLLVPSGDEPTITALKDGGFVLTWSDNGLYGQRFSADGTERGEQFAINTVINEARYPALTALDDGGFVAVWVSTAPFGSDAEIIGQRYHADGTLNGAEFQVNTATDYLQRFPDITTLADGGFVVTWHTLFATSGQTRANVYGQRYNADGTTNGTEFQINTFTDGRQADSQITPLDNGGFVVTWTSGSYNSAEQDGDNGGIFGQRYNADGSESGAEFQINTFTESLQHESKIATLTDGDFVVTWTGWEQDGSRTGIFGQRYNADGTSDGEEFQINTFTQNSQSDGEIVALKDGGFVITWSSSLQDGSSSGVYGQRYNANGSKNGEEFLINTFTEGSQGNARITELENGGFIVIWNDYEQDGVYAKIFGSEFLEFTEDDFLSYTNQDVIADDFEVIGTTEIHLAGNSWKARELEYTVTENSYVTFDYKTVVEGEIHGLIFLEDGLDPNASSTVHQGLDLIRLDGFQTYGSPALYTESTDTFQTITVKLSDYYEVGTDISHLVFVNDDDANAAGESVFKDIKLFEDDPIVEPEPNTPTLVGSEEFQVSTIGSSVLFPQVTTLADEGFVVTWKTASGSRFFGQSYNADGSMNGEEFQIGMLNINPLNNQDIIALPDGGFMATWSEYFIDPFDMGNSFDIFAQRYNADGSTNGEGFRVNTHINNSQSTPSITILTDGGYAVTWNSQLQDGDGHGVFGQRYNANGSMRGEEFQVNTTTEGNQYNTSIMGLSNGGFIVTWDSQQQDQESYRVFGQRYNADGSANGEEFLISTTATPNSTEITALANDEFVVTWNSALQNGTDIGNFGRIYNSDGNATGEKLLINSVASNEYALSDITALTDGGFVAMWYGVLQDDVTVGLFGQRYNPDGSKNGEEFVTVSFTDSLALYPSFTELNDTDFVVTWLNVNTDVGGVGIFAKIFRPVPEFLEFSEDDFISYTNQDVIVEAFEVIDNTEIHISGNTWKALDFEYTVTENSLVTFDYKTAIEGEIHGLIFLEDGLDPNASGIVHQGLDLIRMDGFQSYGGPSALYTEPTDTFQSITVNLSDYYDVGTDISHLIFVNDDDANAAGESVYKNIKVHEENGIYGDAANNILSGTSEADYLYGDSGADTFVFDASSFDAVDVIGDFDISEGDALDISDVLIGYDAVTDAISDFVQITDNGADSTLSVDINGSADNYVPIAILSNATGLSEEDALETSGNLITI